MKTIENENELTFDIPVLKSWHFQGLFHKALRNKYHYLFGQKTKRAWWLQDFFFL